MTETVTAAGTEILQGRNRITPRAIRSVVSAITAEALDTRAKNVGVELGDDGGVLTVTATAPVHITSLATLAPGAAPGHGAQLTVLQRAAAAQNSIRDRVLILTGSTVGSVNLRLASAQIEDDERVQ